ncbi:MAG TPA: hypothetical protein VG013_31805, partial [Gemmataceae bacterium]|nr:hypothetical protein [Gemmataceae bacterium]
MRAAVFATLASLALVLAVAADEPLDPGLKPVPKDGKPGPENEIPGPFHPFNITGKDEFRGKFHSVVSEHSLDPVVLIFVRGTKPATVGTLLAQLDEAVKNNERLRLAAVVVFLSNEMKDNDLVADDVGRDKAAAEIQDKLAKYKNIAAVLDVPPDVKDFKLNDKAEVTVLMYNKYRVVLGHAYPADGLKGDEAAKALMGDISGQL